MVSLSSLFQSKAASLGTSCRLFLPLLLLLLLRLLFCRRHLFFLHSLALLAAGLLSFQNHCCFRFPPKCRHSRSGDKPDRASPLLISLFLPCYSTPSPTQPERRLGSGGRRLHSEPNLRPAPTHNPAPHAPPPSSTCAGPRPPPAPPASPRPTSTLAFPAPGSPPAAHFVPNNHGSSFTYVHTYPRRLEGRRRILLALSFRKSPLPRHSRDSGSAERISFRFHSTRIPSFSFFPKIPSFLPLFSPEPVCLL